MNWIKEHYDQFILGLVAVLLLVLSGLLINSAIGFQQTFDIIKDKVSPNNTVPLVDMSGLEQSGSAVANPATAWPNVPAQGSLFVSIPYIVKDNELVKVGNGGPALHPPIPNDWILAHKLDILDNNILNEDQDGDGFTNLDEWRNIKGDGSDSTDPIDKASHPEYFTKLRLVQYIRKPFRLLLNAWDGDPNKPETLDLQINTVDVHQPSQFVHIGDMIKGTKFKVISFAEKHKVNAATQSTDDVSELTVQNTETNDNVILIVGKVANSPDSYASFRYLWNGIEFQVKKDKEFALLPEADKRYKLIDIKDDEALIQTPNSQQVRVPKLDEAWSATMFTPKGGAPAPAPAAAATPTPAAVVPAATP